MLQQLSNLLLSFPFRAKGTYPAAYRNALNSSLVKGGASCLLLLTVRAWHWFISVLSKIFWLTCWISIPIKELLVKQPW